MTKTYKVDGKEFSKMEDVLLYAKSVKKIVSKTERISYTTDNGSNTGIITSETFQVTLSSDPFAGF